MLGCPKSKRPDWQSEQLNLGLEATRAISNKEGEAQFVINQCFGTSCNMEFIQQDIYKRFPKHKHYTCDNIKYVALPIDLTKKRDAIAKAIIDKSESLNKHYSTYPHNWLYVFAESGILQDHDAPKIWVQSKDRIAQQHYHYDNIFMNDMNSLYVIRSDGSTRTIPIASNVLENIMEAAIADEKLTGI